MNPRARLEHYLDALRWRLRTLIYTRAAAAGALSVVLLTALWVWMLDREGFPSHLAAIGRVTLLAALAIVAIALLWWPLRKLARHQGADEIERRLPAQRGRIATYLDMRRREAEGVDSPLLDLLAGDATTLADATPVRDVVPGPHIWIAAAIAAVAAAVLVFLLTAGPNHWGYGARHLLLGAALPRTAVPVRRVVVTPGDATIRRNSDLAISASVEGFRPDEAQVFVRFDDEQEWQRAPMQVAADGGQWEFKLYAVRGPLHYYVQAGNAQGSQASSQHTVGVVDLPHIERMRLTYEYPQWTDLPARTEETVRDIHAVPGTGVKLEVFATASLESPIIVVNGEQLEMDAAGGAATGRIEVSKEGTYRISARVANELVALTDDYAIQLVADEKPTIAIEKPGRDWRATSIEEVPVRINAQDDFRLQAVELHYAVNGGEWQKTRVARGGKQARSDSLLKLEELGTAQHSAPVAAMAEPPRLAPGDLVSYYAVARDRNNIVQTDLFMVQVQPFERRFTQGQGGGGGGGGGPADEQGAISERQREILLATWNLQRSDSTAARSRVQLQENAKMLAEMQATLAQQARTLSQRTRARVSLDQDERIKQFVESLERAAALMDPAAKHLNEFKLAQAVPAEQQALQQLLRAESAFRDVQISMQQDSSGGGGEQAARNFTEMFELEMDVDKNHYETESQLAKEQKQEELDDTIRKLKELAQRQEKLAQEAQRQSLPEREQRWRQEQLRREAEDLRRRLAELERTQNSPSNSQANASRQQQSGQQQSGQQQSGQQQSGQQSGGQSGQQQSEGQQSQGQQSGSQSQVANALETMRRALDDMRAASSGQPGSPAAGESAREASRKLRQALDQIDQPASQGLSEKLEQFASRTDKLAEEQRRTEADLYDAITEAQAAGRQRGQLDPRRTQSLTKTKQEMAEELQSLQQELRNTMNDSRTKQPATTQRLGEIVSELENTNVVSRINRSAAEIQYGRARDAASREGLITDVLDSLEKGLRDTAQFAAREAEDAATPADPEAVLAELSALRRALQEAQSGQGEPGSEPGQGRSSRQGEEQQAGGDGSQQGEGGTPRQASSGQPGTPGAGGSASSGLGAWNPSAPSRSPQRSLGDFRAGLPGNLETGAARIGRDAAQVAESLRHLADRMKAAELSPAEINALRRMAHELRSLAGDPMASQAQAMNKLVDRIELATLAVADKARNAPPAHTSASTAEEPEYREAVAEYYRRLGGSE